MNNAYEIGFLLLPDLTEQEVQDTVEAIHAAVTGGGAAVLSAASEVPMIDLAYTMVKKVRSKNYRYDQAHFGWVKFSAEADQVAAINKVVEALEPMLRFLTIKTVASDELTDKFALVDELASEKSDEEMKTEFSDTVDEGSEKSAEAEVSEDDLAPADEATNLDDESAVDASAEGLDQNDDLTMIEGVGPAIAAVFADNDIHSFADLAAATKGQLTQILSENGLGSHKPDTWPDQAVMARDGKFDELKAWQDELAGGIEK